MDASTLDAALLDMTDTQVMAALARRTAAKEAQKRAVTAARVSRFRNANVTPAVTPKKRYISSECNASCNAFVTPDHRATPSPSPSLSPVPPIPPTPTPNPLNPPEPPPAAGGGNGKEAEEKRQKPAELRALSIRIGSIVRRKPSTDWLPKEKSALAKLHPIPEADLTVVERYYAAPIDAGKDYRRRDLFTLLNNWPGEVDRANRHCGLNGHHGKCGAVPTALNAADLAAFISSDPDHERYRRIAENLPPTTESLPEHFREKFASWKFKNR